MASRVGDSRTRSTSPAPRRRFDIAAQNPTAGAGSPHRTDVDAERRRHSPHQGKRTALTDGRHRGLFEVADDRLDLALLRGGAALGVHASPGVPITTRSESTAIVAPAGAP